MGFCSPGIREVGVRAVCKAVHSAAVDAAMEGYWNQISQIYVFSDRRDISLLLGFRQKLCVWLGVGWGVVEALLRITCGCIEMPVIQKTPLYLFFPFLPLSLSFYFYNCPSLPSEFFYDIFLLEVFFLLKGPCKFLNYPLPFWAPNKIIRKASVKVFMSTMKKFRSLPCALEIF